MFENEEQYIQGLLNHLMDRLTTDAKKEIGELIQIEITLKISTPKENQEKLDKYNLKLQKWLNSVPREGIKQ